MAGILNYSVPSGTIGIDVFPPIKGPDLYEFRFAISRTALTKPAIIHRIRSTVRGYGSLTKTIIRCGYKALNFEIAHHEVWDSIYPLMFLVRKGGPLFGQSFPNAKINFHYPIHGVVADFFVNRAEQHGECITIDGPRDNAKYHLPTMGTALSFGGGKDSRALLGILRELSYQPEVFSATMERLYQVPLGIGCCASDIQDVKTYLPLSGRLIDRIMPALMSRPANYFCGSALGEVSLQHPWNEYYDLAAPKAIAELTNLFKSVGLDIELRAPLSVLPYNIVQKILFDRYPELYRYQQSANKNERSEKNLHVSLLKYYHGISFEEDCDLSLFCQLLKEFVHAQTSAPDYFGYRRYREVINREMRSIIAKRRGDELFSEVRDLVPESWEGDWIDGIHSYVYPDLPEEFLSIYRNYAHDIRDGNSDRDYRVQAA